MTSGPARFTPGDRTDRDDAAAFAGRVARWDPKGPLRVKADGDTVRLWATTPFDTLATRAVHGSVTPSDVTVYAGNLLSALAVSTAESVDPGPVNDASWRAQLPPPGGWIDVDRIPVEVLTGLTERGTEEARSSPGPTGGASTSLLDSEVLTVSGSGMNVVLPMRMLFALSGMGFAPDGADEQVRVRATDAWARIDARYGSVVRRRHALLPLLF